MISLVSFLLKEMCLLLLDHFPKLSQLPSYLYANKSIIFLYTKKGYEYNHSEPVTKHSKNYD